MHEFKKWRAPGTVRSMVGVPSAHCVRHRRKTLNRATHVVLKTLVDAR